MNYYTLPKNNNFIDSVNLLTSKLQTRSSLSSYESKGVVSPSLNNVKVPNEKETDSRSIYDSTDESTHISKTLCAYLKIIKRQIDNNMDLWDNMKKYTNPYEFIHTVIPGCKVATSQLKPLSRSFYKMIEISHTMELFTDLSLHSIQTFHLAEGPGGFIEATRHIRCESLNKALLNKGTTNNNSNNNNESIPPPPGLEKNVVTNEEIKEIYRKDKHYGMTLLNESDSNIPGWGKSKGFLKKNPNVSIEKGVTGTGDLLRTENLLHYYHNFNNSMDIVTGDGGFDFSIDFNHQELLASKLLFAQICFALAIQKEGGHFVLKVFDLFTKPSLECLYILSSMYEEVHIIKPSTSRLANSEKYLVCKYFRRNEMYTRLMDSIIANFHLLSCDPSEVKEMNKDTEHEKNSSSCTGASSTSTKESDDCNNVHTIIKSILPFPIEYYFVNKVEDYNAIFGQQQIENITTTMSNISSKAKADKIDNLKKNNIMKCLAWCEKHNIPSNQNVIHASLYSKSQKKHNSHHHGHNSHNHSHGKPKW